MNKTEQRFEQNVLWARKAAGEVLGWKFEPLKLRLADKTFYTPDFLVILADGTIELAEVKGGGGWEDDARVKIKVAAETFPEFLFAAYREQRGRQNLGRFDREEF